METETRYRVAPSPLFTPRRIATARPYSRIEDAISAMGDGVVVSSGGEVVAFHERHLDLMCRMGVR